MDEPIQLGQKKVANGNAYYFNKKESAMKIRSRILVRVIASLLSLLILVSLSGVFVGVQAKENPEYTFYMIVHGGIAHPFWKVVEKGAKDAGALLPEVKVIYSGPEAYNFEKFMALVESAIAARPDGLLVTITSYPALDGPLRKAIENGIPVMAINAKDPRSEDERIPYLIYVGEDHYAVGAAMAKRSMRDFTPKRAVFGNHHPGAFHIEERQAGFVDTLRNAGIPAEGLDVTEDPVKGAQILIDYIRAHPDTDLVYPGATPHVETFVIRASEEGFTQVKVPCIDLSPRVLDYILKDQVMFTIDQQQYLQGFNSVIFMFQHVKYGFATPPKFPTGPAIIEKEDIPLLQELVKEGYR